MKFTSIVYLASTLLFLMGCASTTTKTYSADFKVSPVETKDVGEITTTPDGTEYTIRQQYKFEGVITETTTISTGESSSRIVASPSLTTISKGSIRFGTKPGDGESKLEVSIEENDDQTHASFKATINEHDAEPIVCAQTIIIQK